MAVIEELPSAVSDLLRREYGTSDGYHLAVSSDIASDGTFAESWLVINGRDLLVIEQTDSGLHIVHRIASQRVTGAKTESLIGKGLLEVEVDGHPTSVMSFSNSLMGKFNRVAKQIDKLAKNERVSTDDVQEDQRQRCEKCGRLLDNWSKVCPKCINKKRILGRLLAYALPYKGLLVLAASLTLASTALELVWPYFTKRLIDDALVPVVQGHDVAYRIRLLALLVVAMVVVRISSAAMAVLRGRVSVFLGSRITFDVRTRLYDALQRLSLSYFDKRQIGAVMTRVTQDTNQLSGFLVEGAQYYVVNVLMVVGIAAILLVKNWKLGLLVIVPAPLLVVITVFIWRRLMQKLHHFWHMMSRLSAILNDALSGIRVVKAFGQENTEVDRFNNRSQELYEASLRVDQTFATVFPVLNLVMISGSLLVWWFGGQQVIGKAMTLGDLMMFFMYIGMFYAPLQILTRVSEWMSRSLTSADRIFEVMDTIPEVKDAPDAVPMPYIKGELEFDNVSFGYDKNKPVLTDVSFSVRAGEMIGLVGHSGAGKSTTINLICRLYDVNEGSIKIDGVDVRNIKLSDLRPQIGVVLQDPFLFNGTVAENIAYGRQDATREEIMAAAKAANAHEFIMNFSDGYDTVVRERGQRLSGGERQRISIARAILRNPRILILDEATSSVDTETEKQLQEAISNLVKDRTTFAIAHRLSTLRNADRLLVLENGKFVEFGTHEELLRKQGVYYKLVQLQKEVSKIKAVDG